jgi:hypothetical protein
LSGDGRSAGLCADSMVCTDWGSTICSFVLGLGSSRGWSEDVAAFELGSSANGSAAWVSFAVLICIPPIDSE